VGIKPVRPRRPDDRQALDRSGVTHRPDDIANFWNTHAMAISGHATVAAAEAVVIPKQAENHGSASALALRTPLVLDQHLVDQDRVGANS
jgi:hypothetical protein